jgi:hypothetical protein
MILDITKLKFIPSYFEQHPLLLHEVIATEVKEECEGQVRENMQKLYVGCDCTDNKLYWESRYISETPVEIFACGKCGTWSMSVTY